MFQLQAGRLKEQVERLTENKEKYVVDEQKQQEELKRAQRQMRDTRDELGDVQRKEAESSQRKHDLVGGATVKQPLPVQSLPQQISDFEGA